MDVVISRRQVKLSPIRSSLPNPKSAARPHIDYPAQSRPGTLSGAMRTANSLIQRIDVPEHHGDRVRINTQGVLRENVEFLSGDREFRDRSIPER